MRSEVDMTKIIKGKIDCITTSAMMERKGSPLILCVVGFSGSGKTTVMEKLITEFKSYGLCIGTIKHDAHGFEMDRPGKDTWRHKQAGAVTTIITSPSKIGMVMDVDHDHQPMELIPFFTEMDLVLVEGFKRADLPKIEVFRPETGKLPACKGDRHLLALVCDEPIDWGVPRFTLSDINCLAGYIVELFDLNRMSNAICKTAVC